MTRKTEEIKTQNYNNSQISDNNDNDSKNDNNDMDYDDNEYNKNNTYEMNDWNNKIKHKNKHNNK